MRISDMASIMIRNQQFQRQKGMAHLSNGSLPPEGHVNPFEDPDLNITGKSPSEWQKIVPVDKGVAEKLRNLIKEDFTERSGMCGYGRQADAQASIIKDYISTLPGKDKLAAAYSCEQIAYEEADRLRAIIIKENPDWQYGQSFDTSILDDGNGLDIKA